MRTCGQNTLHAHLLGEERVDVSASKTNGSPSPAWLIAIDPLGRQEWSEAFLSNGMDQQEADDKHDMEATVQGSDGS